MKDSHIQNLRKALDIIAEHDDDAGDGQWLEGLTRDYGACILEWGISQVWKWEEWPDLEKTFGPAARRRDDGIDLVAERKGGGGWLRSNVKHAELVKRGKRYY